MALIADSCREMFSQHKRCCASLPHSLAVEASLSDLRRVQQADSLYCKQFIQVFLTVPTWSHVWMLTQYGHRFVTCFRERDYFTWVIFYSSCFTPCCFTLSLTMFSSSSWLFTRCGPVSGGGWSSVNISVELDTWAELKTLTTVLFCLAEFRSAVCMAQWMDSNWLIIMLAVLQLVCSSHSPIFWRAPSWGRT